ncbi:MAG: NPCBM/NEW2 domain-containing protein [Planctomycetes bacterium]|nr:NPCBM/NEW2 domain-containing protein [Planctomycetota bacterium]
MRFLLSWFVLTCCANVAISDPVRLGALDLSKMQQGWGTPRVDASVEGHPLRIGGRAFAHGVGSHAASRLTVKLGGGTERFTAWVGVDDEVGERGSIVFQVLGDGKTLYRSEVIRGGEAAQRIDVALHGVEMLILVTAAGGDGIDYDHADWAEATFHVAGTPPVAVDAPQEDKAILTPTPGPEPRLNGPLRFGVRPGRPFLYRVPCTGERPMTFTALNLPESLALDPTTGIVTGNAPSRRGSHAITWRATNAQGSAERSFELVVGDELALTPPMGWNSWYIHYHRVTDADMRAAADAMIASGMADFGYAYVNIDDCWMKRRGDEPYRDANGAVLANAKFQDMNGLATYIHDKGLRAGLYTSPGPWTCAGYVGSYEHEDADAHQFAAWGFDFLKYDWCSYGQVATGEGLERLQKPYRAMAAILRGQERDLVLNLCQYGMGSVWEWGGAVGGHCWRTTGDLGLERGALLPGFYAIGRNNARHHEYAGPGRWNDPDYLLLGWVGDAHQQGEGRPTTLTSNEQYSYMSMWCLMAAPLIFSGDMTKLDPFTLNVLCNAEVIAIDQDPLGVQARIVADTEETFALARPLHDGSVAVGWFNLAEVSRKVKAQWSDLGLAGAQRIRDPWRQVDRGVHAEGIELEIPRHGVALLRLWPARD